MIDYIFVIHACSEELYTVEDATADSEEAADGDRVPVPIAPSRAKWPRVEHSRGSCSERSGCEVNSTHC